MKLSDYLKTTDAKEFAGGGGLPEGKTVFELAKTEIQEITGLDGKPRWKLAQSDKEYIVPKTVMQGLQKEQAKGKNIVEVVRQGTGKTDTKYTILGV